LEMPTDEQIREKLGKSDLIPVKKPLVPLVKKQDLN
jgi:hypothetical protein